MDGSRSVDPWKCDDGRALACAVTLRAAHVLPPSSADGRHDVVDARHVVRCDDNDQPAALPITFPPLCARHRITHAARALSLNPPMLRQTFAGR